MNKFILILTLTISTLIADDWNPSLQLNQIRDCQAWSAKKYKPEITKSVWKRSSMKFYDFEGACRCMVLDYADSESIDLSSFKSHLKFLKESRKFNKNEFELSTHLSDEKKAEEYVEKVHTFKWSLLDFHKENVAGSKKFITQWKSCLEDNIDKNRNYQRTLSKSKR